MAILIIEGVGMPNPSSLKIPMSDVDSSDSGRNEMAILQRDRVRQGVYKLELEWSYINSSDVATILTAIEPPKLQVTFPTPYGNMTKTMYCGDRQLDAVLYRNGNDPLWTLSFNLIEY